MTLEDRLALKAAKSSYKQAIKHQEQKEKINIEKVQQHNEWREKHPRILSGVLDSEKELSPSYPVYWNYLYVAQIGDESKVVISDVQGTVSTLSRDLSRLYKLPIGKIFSCDMHKRNLVNPK